MDHTNNPARGNTFFNIPILYKMLIGGLRNIKNKYLKNEKNTWDAQYKNNYSLKMDCADQQPRNQTISGIVLKNFKSGMNVLDIGCGNGTLFNYFSELNLKYTGIDLSQFAVEEAKKSFADKTNGNFLAEDFENFQSGKKFDAIIFNEVLYYFAYDKITGSLNKAFNMLNSNGGIVIISMSQHLKSMNIWKMIKDIRAPFVNMEIKSCFSGSRWSIKAYTNFDD